MEILAQVLQFVREVMSHLVDTDVIAFLVAIVLAVMKVRQFKDNKIAEVALEVFNFVEKIYELRTEEYGDEPSYIVKARLFKEEFERAWRKETKGKSPSAVEIHKATKEATKRSHERKSGAKKVAELIKTFAALKGIK